MPARVGGGAQLPEPRTGNLYVQYWLYYPGCATGEGSIAPDVVAAAHAAAVGAAELSPYDWVRYQRWTDAEDIRLIPIRPICGASHEFAVGGGVAAVAEAHAGSMNPGDLAAPYARPPAPLVITTPTPIAAEPPRDVRFAITLPWLKQVWRDPEHVGTD